jgi:hypothetical protein
MRCAWRGTVVKQMKRKGLWLAALIAFLACGQVAAAQNEENSANTSVQPPTLLLLVHQEFLPGKDIARHKLDAAMSRACEKLNVPNSWIDLEAITGRPERLSFDAFDSFEQIDHAAAEWPKIFTNNPSVGRLQEEIQALLTSERTVIALRRDDLGYRAGTIDLSKARVMRVLEVHLYPGHERDFAAAFKSLSAAYERINSDTPWVVYQVNVGEPSPTFLVFVPMTALRQNDDLIARRSDLLSVEGEERAERMQQIAREAYASTESNLYVVSPEMSHVSKEFAAGDPQFWKSAASPKPSGNKSEQNQAAPQN